jgi:hypothetical protein
MDKETPVELHCFRAIQKLDTMSEPVSRVENRFLLTLKRSGLAHVSPDDKLELARMVEDYLGDHHLAAELLGQQALL